MKKAKIMLSAIAVFAVVSGAMAFKAHKFNQLTYYFCNTSTQKCQSKVIAAGTITTLGTASFTSSATLATVAGADCAAQGCTHPLYSSAGQ